MKFIDIPKHIRLTNYESEISRMVDRLKSFKEVKSVYQIGSVSSPGISDIDMFVIFNDGNQEHSDPRQTGKTNNYLFTHELYGSPIKYWHSLRNFTFFHNYCHLYGQILPNSTNNLTNEDQNALKRQIALEFLVKMYYMLSIQLTYKIVKLRTFLLEGKALIYDLEFLGISSGRMFDLVKEIIDLRGKWFNQKQDYNLVWKLIYDLHKELKNLLIDLFSQYSLYLPSQESQTIAQNIALKNSKVVSIKRKGIVFPFYNTIFPHLNFIPERKFFNLLHRFNNFTVNIPYSIAESGSIIQKRFELLSEMREYNQNHLPRFLIPASSLKII
ncbi:MAG: hypothetical protein NXI23_10835 [Bacteroidetes bacterium]|nr:hypothetical protein [Bacteroidota bacterium]